MYRWKRYSKLYQITRSRYIRYIGYIETLPYIVPYHSSLVLSMSPVNPNSNTDTDTPLPSIRFAVQSWVQFIVQCAGTVMPTEALA